MKKEVRNAQICIGKRFRKDYMATLFIVLQSKESGNPGRGKRGGSL